MVRVRPRNPLGCLRLSLQVGSTSISLRTLLVLPLGRACRRGRGQATCWPVPYSSRRFSRGDERFLVAQVTALEIREFSFGWRFGNGEEMVIAVSVCAQRSSEPMCFGSFFGVFVVEHHGLLAVTGS